MQKVANKKQQGQTSQQTKRERDKQTKIQSDGKLYENQTNKYTDRKTEKQEIKESLR